MHQQSRSQRAGWASFAVAAVILASCSDNTTPIESTSSILSSTPPTTTSETTSTTQAPNTTEPASTEVAPTRTGVSSFDGRETSLFYSEGTTLRIVFPEALNPSGEGDCVAPFESVATATPDTVQLTLYRLDPSESAQPEVDGVLPICSDTNIASEFVVELPEPLNGRPLIRSTDGTEIPVAETELLRVPTLLPGAWEVGFPSTVDRVTVQQFGPVNLTVMSAHTRGRDRLEGLKGNALHEVHQVGDGVEAVYIPRPDGTQRLSFVIDDWFYDLEAEADTRTPQLFRFADSFEVGDTASALAQRWAERDTVPLDNEGIPITFYTRGDELVAGFPSIDLTVPIENPCSVQFEPVINEGNSAVNVVIETRLGDAPDGCERDPFITLPIPLEAPLGGRTLRYNDITVGTTGVFSRSMPTVIPQDWQPGPDATTEFLGGARQYGPTVVSSSPTTPERNIELFRSLDHQVVNVLDIGDGVLVTREDGSFQLVFEDFGWVYEITTQPGVDRTVLFGFAQSFQ